VFEYSTGHNICILTLQGRISCTVHVNVTSSIAVIMQNDEIHGRDENSPKMSTYIAYVLLLKPGITCTGQVLAIIGLMR